MDSIRLKCRKMVDDNVAGEIDEDVRELLTIAVMAIVINKEKIALQKLPTILQRLNIFAENKSVLEIAHERLGNYSEDDALRYADASATRMLEIDEENGTIEEQFNLLISLTDIERKNTANMIEKITNGLIHLMRYGTIESNDSSISIKDGISTMTFSKKNRKLRKKHFTLEGGVTQYYTLQSLDKLYNFIENEYISDDAYLNKFKTEYKSHQSACYLFPVTVVELLCEDQQFRRLLDESFEESKGPSKVALYYNEVMHDGSAFTFLSHQIDCCTIETDNGDDERALSSLEIIKKEITRFKREAKTYQKKRV